MNKFFILFSNCILVHGVKRALVNDLITGCVYAIPIEIESFFHGSNCLDIDKGLSSFKNITEKEIFLEFISYLEEVKVGFFSHLRLEGFDMKLNTDFNYPYILSNILLDIKTFNSKNLQLIFDQIENLKIRHLELRILSESFDFKNLYLIYNLIDKTHISSFSLMISNSVISSCSLESFYSFRLTKVIVFNSEVDKIEVYRDTNIIYYSQKIISERSCGLILEKHFTLNMLSFTEAHHHNTCLNRKISIDAEGNIRNCPSMPQSFGNIKDTTLQQALDHPDFKKYWNHKKDEIEVCRDCEFRYICTNCRAYLEDPQNEYSKPLKCGYDPYTGEWSEWSTNPLKQAAIKYYGMEEMVANKLDNSFTG